jgi:cell division protein FtsI (penicillin-binding protein 3)
VVGLWILVLLVRLVDLQVLRRDEFTRRARKQQERTVELAPRRGVIRDADGTLLAVNARAESVFAIPSDVADAAQEAALLAPLLRHPANELAKKLASPDRDFVWLSRRVSDGVAARVRALVAEKRLPGIQLVAESTRRYPEGTLAAAVLGYVGTDNQGLAGLEYRFDADVRGKPARVTLLRDAAQRSYATRARAGGEASPEGNEGARLTLTLRTGIQHAAERELAKIVAESHARGASAVVLDPASGAILALASWPTFDPNRFGDVDAEARRCRPLADVYEPGSTFKIVAAATALDSGTIGLDDLIDCGGGTLTVGSNTIHEHGGKGWSTLNIGDILAHSSNIGIAHVAMTLGRVPFYNSVRAFGFGQKTGVELEGETAGILEDKAAWSALTLPTMAFGQEIGVTVLQMARAYAAIANGGVLPPVHLVDSIRSPDDADRRIDRPTPRRLMSEETARQMRVLLQRVVEMGTGKAAAIPGYTAAGKTGTAQKAVQGGGYSKDRYVASFIGFTPAERPRVVVAVVVDEPRGKTYGSEVAAPVFAAISADALRILREPSAPADATRPSVLIADLGAGVVAASVLSARLHADDLVPAVNRVDRGGDGEDRVPDVSGKGARDAVRFLASRGLSAQLSGTGFVVSQDPPAGAPAERGAACALVLHASRAAGDTP